jgi:predicted nucleic acid-binding protein
VTAERFVIDSNVLSELARPASDPRVVDWFRQLERPATSAIVVYELSRGIERLARGKRRTFLESWFAELMAVMETLPVDQATALAAARIEVAAHRSGKSVEVRDLLIVATAQAHGCTVATRNLDHQRGLGVVLYDPFNDLRTM